MNIGVLAVQGAFIEHEKMLSELGASVFEIRQRADLNKSVDGLIIPGGESTVQGKLLKELGMFDELKAMLLQGLYCLRKISTTMTARIRYDEYYGSEKCIWQTAGQLLYRK